MGIQVWMLGEGRAIPRNYHHTVISDAQIDWLNAGQNYNDVVVRATREAPDRHTFVTEFAGSSSILQGLLDYPGRFGTEAELARQGSVSDFFQYLYDHGFAFTAALNGVLYPGDGQQPFDAPALAAQIFERVVGPARAAAALIDRHPTLTRLYTTLSPEDMTRDPVFSFNPGLADFSNVHQSTFTYYCRSRPATDSSPAELPAVLVTEQGHRIYFPRAGDAFARSDERPGPASQRIEALAEEGQPRLVKDNSVVIQASLPTAPPELFSSTTAYGCAMAGPTAGSTRGDLTALLVLLLAVGVAARRQQRGRR
jgi:hypothetical protein